MGFCHVCGIERNDSTMIYRNNLLFCNSDCYSSFYVAVNTRGASVEFQANTTHLQWKYTSEAVWNDLCPLTEFGVLTPGPAGPAGSDGDDGSPGPQGIQGIQGTQGLAGVKGDTGDVGTQGLQGLSGADSIVPGPQGTKGDQGERGLQGLQGNDSTIPGPQGLKGDTGNQGIQGIQGVPGQNGSDGSVGPKGDTGDQGLRGYTGDTGQQGIQGIPGNNGATGEQGNQGIQGVAGVKGDIGSTGLQGITGDTGNQGIQGIQGIQGVAGTNFGSVINVQALTSSPTDSQTVYFGTLPKAPTTTANISKIYIRKACTLKVAEIYCYSGTAGTAEAWSLYVRKNNTTDTLIATLAVSASERVFSNAGLNISLVAGDYIEIKGVQPLWATNPLTTIWGGYLYFE